MSYWHPESTDGATRGGLPSTFAPSLFSFKILKADESVQQHI
jgi:hypothetical protein